MTESGPGMARLTFGLGTSWLAVSSSAVVIVLAAPVPPISIAAIRVAISGVIWWMLSLKQPAPDASSRAPRAAAPPADWPWGKIALSGVLLGLHFGLWIGSLFLTSVPHAAVLVGVQPLFAGIFGRFLGDRTTWRLPAGVAIALVGTHLMTSAEAEGVTLIGDALAVLAAACSAAYLTVNRSIGRQVPLPKLLALVNGFAALSLSVGVVVFGGAAFWHVEAGWREVLAISWLGLGPGLIGHGLMNWAARAVPVHVVSMVILLEPIGAAFLAWIVLHQGVTPLEIGGALLLLAGAALTLVRDE